MNMFVMFAINPPHSGNVLAGIKRVEWCKRPLMPGRCFIYETKNGGGCGMVVGEAFISAVRRHFVFSEISYLLGEDVRLGCVSKEDLKRYAGKNRVLYAHELTNVIRYRTPIPLSDFHLKRAPLSWCYCIPPFEIPDLPDWDLHPKF